MLLVAEHLSTVEGEPFTALYHVLPVPHAPVLLVSGDPAADEEAPAIVSSGALQKPVTQAALLACLQRAWRAAEQEPALTGAVSRR
jgi:hypothetical protein